MATAWIFDDDEAAYSLEEYLFDAGYDDIEGAGTLIECLECVSEINDGDVVTLDSTMPHQPGDIENNPNAGIHIACEIRKREVNCLLLWHSEKKMNSANQTGLEILHTFAGDWEVTGNVTRSLAEPFCNTAHPHLNPKWQEYAIQWLASLSDTQSDMLSRYRTGTYVIEACRWHFSMEPAVGEGVQFDELQERFHSLDVNELWASFEHISVEIGKASRDAHTSTWIAGAAKALRRGTGADEEIQRAFQYVESMYDNARQELTPSAENSPRRVIAACWHDVLSHGYYLFRTASSTLSTAAIAMEFDESLQNAVVQTRCDDVQRASSLPRRAKAEWIGDYVQTTLAEARTGILPSGQIRCAMSDCVSDEFMSWLCDFADMVFRTRTSIIDEVDAALELVQPFRDHNIRLAALLENVDEMCVSNVDAQSDRAALCEGIATLKNALIKLERKIRDVQ